MCIKYYVQLKYIIYNNSKQCNLFIKLNIMRCCIIILKQLFFTVSAVYKKKNYDQPIY